jgi:hypothetical protein
LKKQNKKRRKKTKKTKNFIWFFVCLYTFEKVGSMKGIFRKFSWMPFTMRSCSPCVEALIKAYWGPVKMAYWEEEELFAISCCLRWSAALCCWELYLRQKIEERT